VNYLTVKDETQIYYTYADDLATLMETLDLTNAINVGYSTAAATAQPPILIDRSSVDLGVPT
jgi:hypothetical protein